MPQVWRIVKRTHAATAFDGEGARLFGGRWNSPGRRAVYASASKSLATLELLVHLDASRPVPRLSAYAFEIEPRLIETLAEKELPRGWASAVSLGATQRWGDAWLEGKSAVALAVPSAIVPEETNYLLNPEHPGFAKLRFGPSTPFTLDPRLVE